MNRIVLVILLFMMLCACGSKDYLEQRKLIHSSNHFEFCYEAKDMDEKHKEELKAIILEGLTPKLSTLEKVNNEFLK